MLAAVKYWDNVNGRQIRLGGIPRLPDPLDRLLGHLSRRDANELSF